jgi:hypothetical protein
MVKIITVKPHMEGNLVRRVFYDRSRKVECEIRRENETVFLCFNLKNFFHSFEQIFVTVAFHFQLFEPTVKNREVLYCPTVRTVLYK